MKRKCEYLRKCSYLLLLLLLLLLMLLMLLMLLLWLWLWLFLPLLLLFPTWLCASHAARLVPAFDR